MASAQGLSATRSFPKIPNTPRINPTKPISAKINANTFIIKNRLSIEVKSRALYNTREFHSIKNDREGRVDKLPGIPGAIIPQWSVYNSLIQYAEFDGVFNGFKLGN